MPTLALKGVNLAYSNLVSTSGSSSHAILVHACAANLWGPTPAQIANSGVNVISYDRRGYIGSPATDGKGTTSWEHQTEDLADLVRATTPEGQKTVLIGWSLGSVPCLGVAFKYPELVKGLVLVEPAYAISEYRGPGAFHMVRSVVACLGFGNFSYTAAFGSRAFLRWAFSTEPSAVKDGMKLDPNGYDGCSTEDQATMDANAGAIFQELSNGTGEQFIGADKVAEIKCPVTVLVGKQTVLALNANAPAVFGKLKGSANKKLIEVEGATHLMPLQTIGSEAISKAVVEMANVK